MISEETLERGLKLAEGSTIYGIEFKDLTRDQLIALAALGWSLYKEIIYEC